MTGRMLSSLIAAGRISESPLRTLPLLAAHIGPVLAATPGLATRFCRTLKAGHPSRSPEELCHSRVFVIHAPGVDLATPLGLLEQCCSRWHGRVILLFDEEHDSSKLAPWAERGASVGSFCLLPGPGAPTVAVEGSRLAVQTVRRLCRGSRLSLLRLGDKPRAKPHLLAALTAVDALFPPLVEATVESLRHAGIPRAQAFRLVFPWLEQRMNDYERAGRRTWSSTTRSERRAHILNVLASVRAADPALAEYLAASLRNGLHLMGEESQWLRLSVAASP